MNLPYNLNDKHSIIEFAKKLKGKSLREICDDDILQHNYSGKGNFGQILEKFYFLYEPNSTSEPDFAVAGLELKSSPLKLLKNHEYRSKERLVLNIINYVDIVKQTFETSSFWKKNANILLIFYLHEAGYNILDYIVKLVDEWNFSDTDLEIIKKDWETITQKVKAGKAHELSEGDTYYLGACTKGANATTIRKQPFSNVPAKQRAYSLKQGYVNHIIATIANEPTEIYGKLIPSVEIAKKHSIEEIVISKFQSYYGKTIDEILKILGKKPSEAKSFKANITKAIFGIEVNKDIEEFKKADIEIKTVQVTQYNRIIESTSFSPFEYTSLVDEEWDNSEFKQILERKFLFVFFQQSGTQNVLRKAKFWNMPLSDIEEAKKVWERTKEIISKGNIVREIKGKKRITNFPGKTFNTISHVRPHANTTTHTFPLPFREKFTDQMEYTKHSFWLNNTYVRDEIYLK